MTHSENSKPGRLSRRRFLQQAGGLAAMLMLSRCQTTETPPPSASTVVEPSASTVLGPFTPANAPLGVGRGIHPGRVIWTHNPSVARWDGKTGAWWTDENLDPGGVAEMLSHSLRALTGLRDDAAAWDALFRHFNATHGHGDQGYTAGQKVAVKLNLNVVNAHAYTGMGAYSAPQLVAALVGQLVRNAGVPASAIALYDATRFIPDSIVRHCAGTEFTGLRFVDWAGGNGREAYRRDPAVQVHWSGDVAGNPTYLPTCVTEADYLINLAALRGHNLAGVTLCGKNHFGTICADLDGQPTQQAPQGAGLHGTVAAHDFSWRQPDWAWSQRPVGTYNAIVDLMAHPHLGEKTLLYMLDGLYATQNQNADVTNECRWESLPFQGHWTSSLLISQDGVAIDSAGLDFVRSEPTIARIPDVMPSHTTCENYLHEAALLGDPPSGTTYAPGGTASASPSLGVHEHWDGVETRQYSRNLGTGEGIELIAVS